MADSHSRDSSPGGETGTFRTPLSMAHRIFHPPKLERKHSSGDLHSRLKTRKILGVGETDNGDIHRSKISQVLGHNEHLYVKFPRGYGIWHLGMAILFTMLGLSNFILPNHWHELTLTSNEDSGPESTLVTRYYGATLLAVAVMLWTFWGTTDKMVARCIVSALAVCHILQIFGVIICISQGSSWCRSRISMFIAVRTAMVMANVYFYRTIGSSTSGMRKTPSYKDLVGVSGSRSPTIDNTVDFTPAPITSPNKKTE